MDLKLRKEISKIKKVLEIDIVKITLEKYLDLLLRILDVFKPSNVKLTNKKIMTTGISERKLLFRLHY